MSYYIHPYVGKLIGVNYGADLAPPAKKLEAQGGNGMTGDDWDDGVNDNVRKITVTKDSEGVNSIVFEYAFGTETVIGRTVSSTYKLYLFDSEEEKIIFELADNEYIISVEGRYGKKLPLDENWRSIKKDNGPEYMTKLEFKTNITEYSVAGTVEDGSDFVDTPFTLKEEGHKIVGFYGKSTVSTIPMIQQIGAYVKPIDDA